MDIKIDDIKTLENIRGELGDLGELMASIKQHGLLQPIGLWKEDKEYVVAWGNRRLSAAKKLGWKVMPEGTFLVLPEKFSREDFLALNAVENIHRKDIQPIELGRLVDLLRQTGLSVSEISSKLSISTGKLNNAHQLYKDMPSRHRKFIGYVHGGDAKKGRISATVANKIMQARISENNKDKLLETAKKDELSVQQIDIITRSLNSGVPLGESMKDLDKFMTHSIQIVVSIEQEEKAIQKYKARNVTDLFLKIIKSVEPKLVRSS